MKERLFAHPERPGRARERRLRAADGGPERRRAGDLRRPLRPPDPPRPAALRAAPPAQGSARDRRHRARPARQPPRPRKAAHLDFSIRPAGKGAPRIDPKPILDGWKLLEATAIYRASGRNALRSGDGAEPLLDRPDPADAQAPAREAGAGRRAHQRLRRRPRRHPLGPDRPPRAGHPRLPGGVRPAADGDQPQVAATGTSPHRATSPTTPRATRWTSPRSTASRSSATRSPAA